VIHIGSTHFVLDIGSVAIHGAVIDPDSQDVAHRTSRPFPDPIGGGPSGHVEIDPKGVLSACEAVVDELTSHMGSQCHGWICGPTGGVILTDGLGRPRSNYLSWRDRRTLEDGRPGRCMLDRIRDDWPEPIMASLGRELQPGSMSALLHWLSENRKLPDGVMPLTITDFVISHMARQPGRMHSTMAVGLLELGKCDWHYGALERIGLGDLWWPELSHDLEPIAQWKRGHRNIAIHGAFGEQACGLFGAGLGDEELCIHMAAGAPVSLLSTRFEAGPYQTRKYFGNHWLNTVTYMPSVRSLDQGAVADDAIATHYEMAAKRLGSKHAWRSLVVSGESPASVTGWIPWIQERFPNPIRRSDSDDTLLGLRRLAEQYLIEHA